MAHLYKSLATWCQDSTWMRDRLVTHGAADGMGVYIKLLLMGVWIVSSPCPHWWLPVRVPTYGKASAITRDEDNKEDGIT